MIRVAIVEDEEIFVTTLKDYLAQYGEETGRHIAVTTYADGEDIVDDCRADFDIILMDIEMQSMDGMTAAKHIRRTNDQVIIIFITNMAQYAIQGYEVDALDYIIKPISYFSFARHLDRAMLRLDKRATDTKSIVVTSRGGTTRLPIRDILWVESHGHRLTYHTTNGGYESTVNSMKTVEDTLTPHHFFRCNKGYLVNLARVRGIDANYALIESDRIPISQSKRSAFVTALTDYAGQALEQ